MARNPGVRKAAKQARRRKRQAARDSTWVADSVYQDLFGDRFGDPVGDPVAEAVAGVDEVMAERGWVADDASVGDGMVSWVYPPSATEFDDPAVEPVTRIWISHDGAAELAVGATLVGSGLADDGPYRLDPDRLGDTLEALESYRAGDPRPALG